MIGFDLNMRDGYGDTSDPLHLYLTLNNDFNQRLKSSYNLLGKRVYLLL